MKEQVKVAHVVVVEPKVHRVLPMAELRSRRARKNVLKVTPMTTKPAKTIG